MKKSNKKKMNVQIKDVLRTIINTKGRFIAITLMIALGTMVYVGIRATPPNMEKNLDNYADQTNFQDVSVVSYTGLDEEDQALFESIPDIKKIEYNYEYSAFLKDSKDVIKVHSIPEEVSTYTLVEGRLPNSSKEIAIDETWDLEVGDKVNLEESLEEGQEEKLLNHEFTVVGKVHGPNYMLTPTTGSSNLADGLINYYGIISKDNFLLDTYNSAFLDLERYDGYDLYDKEIKKIDRSTEEELNKLFKNRPDQERDKIIAEANEEIKKAEIEIADGKKELEDAEIELEDARISLDDAWDEYYKGLDTFEREISDAKNTIDENEKLLLDSQVQYEEGLNEYNSGLSELNDSKKLIDQGKEELDKGRLALDENQAKVTQAKSQLEQALSSKTNLEETISQLNTNKNQIQEGLDEVEANLSQVNEQKTQVQAGLDQARLGLSQLEGNLLEVNENIDNINMQINSLEEGLINLDPQSIEYEEVLNQINTLKTSLLGLEESKNEINQSIVQVNSQISQLDKQLATINRGIDEINIAKSQLESNLIAVDNGLLEAQDGLNQINNALNNISPDDLDHAQEEIDNGYRLLEEKEAEFNLGLSQYNEGLLQLEDAKATLDQAKIQLDDGFEELESGKEELLEAEESGRNELEDALIKIQDGEKEYADGKTTFDEEKIKALEEISDGEEEIEEIKKDLQILEIPDYDINGKLSGNTFSLQIENSVSFADFAVIFPFVVYVIAILVTVVTMTRMVEEERTQIGTLKALGYSAKQIANKYYLYGASASLLGLIIGLLGGILVLLPTIINAYFSGFLIEMKLFPPSIFNIIVSILLAFGCTLISTRVVINRSMKEVSSELMRPKKPDKIKKSFLENFPFIWKRLSFLWKVSFRNIAMSKVKNIMTVVGISGCTALLVMGFGIRTSVNNLADNATSGESDLMRIYDFDSMAFYSEKTSDEDLNQLKSDLNQFSGIDYLNIKQDTVNVVDPDSNLLDVTFMVTDNEDKFDDFVMLRNRASGKDLSLSDNGILISEKLSMILDLDINDEIQIEYDGSKYNLKVKGITEQYVNHTIISNSSYFERMTDSSYIPNTYLLRYSEGTDYEEANEAILNLDPIQGVFAVSGSDRTLQSLSDALDVVVYVIIVLSGLLTFVVLFNLANLNISERKRELSTVKVLGFRPKELTLYMFRETMILAVISLFIGFFLGKSLHYAIVVILAPGSILLDLRLYPGDVATALFIAATFVLITIVIFHNKLKKIDMVEALKAVE